MQDHPDKNKADAGLDGLFRKSAEEFEAPYDPTAWLDMQRRLNHHDRTVFWKAWTRRILPTGLILLLLTGGYWLTLRQTNEVLPPVAKESIKDGKPIEATRPTAIRQRRDQQPVNKPVASEPALKPPATVQIETPLADKPVAGMNPLPKPTVANRPPERVRGAASDVRQVNGFVSKAPDSFRPKVIGKRTAGQQTSRHKSRAATVGTATNARIVLSVAMGATNRQGREPPGMAHGLANPDYAPDAEETVSLLTKVANSQEAYLSANEPVGEQRVQLGETGLLMNRPARWPVAPVLPAPISAPSEAAHQPPLTSRARLTGMSVQLVASPDLSAIGLRNVGDAAGNRPGTNVGLLFSYRLSNRWSLQTGVLHSLKVYKATGDDYVWPSNWKWPLWFDGVDARCAMLDVPLNVRYDVLLRPRLGKAGGPSRWFVSGGVTSYVILNERYDYKYNNPTSPLIKAWRWEGRTGTYGLSELNLSVGYEQPISRRLSWQIEPFMKVPLRQVGFFKVRLITTGAFLALRYRF